MTVCLSFLQTEVEEEQQMDMVDTNQPLTTIQRDAAGNNSTMVAPTPWNSL